MKLTQLFFRPRISIPNKNINSIIVKKYDNIKVKH